MKKTLLLLTFTAIIFSAKAQNWAAPGAVWYYSFNNLGYDGYVRIMKTGDTIINGKTCDILEKYRKGYNYFTTSWDSGVFGKDYTYMQNDTVFNYRLGQFYLLYDFNANATEDWIVAGWNTANPCVSSDTVSVDSSSTMVINSDTLKSIYMRPLSMNYWPEWQFTNGWPSGMPSIVEKIGGLGYMFPEPCCVVDLNEGGYLRCYSDSSGWSYQTGISPTCDFIIGVNEIENSFSFSIFPNPSSGMFLINTEDVRRQMAEVEVYDVLGQKIENIPLAPFKGGIALDLTKEAKGIYFVRVIDGKGNYSVKKIIIE